MARRGAIRHGTPKTPQPLKHAISGVLVALILWRTCPLQSRFQKVHVFVSLILSRELSAGFLFCCYSVARVPMGGSSGISGENYDVPEKCCLGPETCRSLASGALRAPGGRTNKPSGQQIHVWGSSGITVFSEVLPTRTRETATNKKRRPKERPCKNIMGEKAWTC